MIELLVTIGIILILIGIAFVAIKYATGSAKANATRTTLKNLSGMLTEFDTQTHLQTQPTAWCWFSAPSNIVDTTAAVTPATTNLNFWTIPYRNTGITGNPPESLDAPGLVDENGDAAARNGSFAIINTMVAMSFISRSSANRDAILKLPTNQIMVPQWTGGTFMGPGSDGVLGNNGDQPVSVTYVAGCHVQHFLDSDKKTHFFVSTMTPAGAGSSGTPPATAAPPSGTWRDETAAAQHAPLLLDAWGNPIIFVPASGLRVRILKDKKANDPTDPSQTFIVVSPGGQVQQYDSATAPQPYVITPGRPFWASAGPDGDFSKGDDNIYSFEQ